MYLRYLCTCKSFLVYYTYRKILFLGIVCLLIDHHQKRKYQHYQFSIQPKKKKNKKENHQQCHPLPTSPFSPSSSSSSSPPFQSRHGSYVSHPHPRIAKIEPLLKLTSLLFFFFRTNRIASKAPSTAAQAAVSETDLIFL